MSGMVDLIRTGGGSSERCLTRRSLVQTGLMVASLGAVSFVFGGSMAAFANDEGDGGGGGGDGGDSGGDGGGDYTTGIDHIWFDRGGNIEAGIDPAQGWDDASIAYFLDILMRQKHGHPVCKITQLINYQNRTPWEVAEGSCQRALENARRRSGQSHARIVGIGYWWMLTKTTGDIGWGPGEQNTFQSLMGYATGGASELTHDGGWDNEVHQGGSEALPGEIWRDYVYRIGGVDLPGSGYGFVAIAVANGQPEVTGFLDLMKSSRSDSWL